MKRKTFSRLKVPKVVLHLIKLNKAKTATEETAAGGAATDEATEARDDALALTLTTTEALEATGPKQSCLLEYTIIRLGSADTLLRRIYNPKQKGATRLLASNSVASNISMSQKLRHIGIYLIYFGASE